MRYQVIGCGAMAVALFAGGATIAAQQDAKVQAILAATHKGIGEKTLDALKTLSVQATLQRNAGNFQSQTEVEMLLDMPDKYVRTDTSTGMMNFAMTTGFNGDRAIMPSGMRVLPGGATVFSMTVGGSGGGHPEGEKPTPEQLDQMNKTSLRNYRQEISRLTLGWFGATHPSLKAQYSYVGEAESPDGKAHVIDVKDDDGFQARLFIDQNSKLPLMVTYQGRQRQVMTSGGGAMTRVSGEQGSAKPLTEEEVRKLRAAATPAPMVEYSLFFEDWREVDGINFPHVIRRSVKGTTDEEWTISKVKVNPRLDAKRFTVEPK